MLIAFKPLNCMSLMQIICRCNIKNGKYSTNIDYISVAIEITANGSRMDQSCVIQKISRELTTPL